MPVSAFLSSADEQLCDAPPNGIAHVATTTLRQYTDEELTGSPAKPIVLVSVDRFILMFIN